MSKENVVIVGAGIGGLAAAIALASRGLAVTVLEAADAPGGKMRQIPVAGRLVDGGPTVLTMRWVFDELLAEAGTAVERELTLVPSALLARHAWGDAAPLDLYVDVERSADAIAAFAGPAEARAYRTFMAQAADVHATLERPFLRDSRPGMLSLTWRIGLRNLPALLRLDPFGTLAQALARSFRDPRLRQLYGRYATYCGSSPYAAPATLMLVAHVEQAGVWFVEGGMHRLARSLEAVAVRLGVTVRYRSPVARVLVENGRAAGAETRSGERFAAGTVVLNTDASAVGAGLLGPDIAAAATVVQPGQRSLSAIAVAAVAKPSGFPLLRHNVFFNEDYTAEFDGIFRDRRLPDDPTVYVCAQDRGDEPLAASDPERFLLLVNAPATGDTHPFPPAEIATCLQTIRRRLARSGLDLPLEPDTTRVTSPADFAALFPGTGGALYGRASHGWRASFQRPDARTPVPGLYLAGGSVHPGPGVPMAALSGRLAARAVLSDLASTSRSLPAAMPGGTSTP